MRLLILSLLLVLGACASQPAPVSHYLLRTDVQQGSGEMNPSSDYYFRTLTVAEYLDQPGLVLETAPGEIHVAKGHRWAEPLRQSLRVLLADEVSALTGQEVLFVTGREDGIGIDLRIDQLHGTADGDAVLVAYWRLGKKGADEIRAYRFSQKEPLAGDGYEAMVAAEKTLLRKLATEIAGSLDISPEAR